MERVHIVLPKILCVNVDYNSFITLAVTLIVMHNLIINLYVLNIVRSFPLNMSNSLDSISFVKLEIFFFFVNDVFRSSPEGARVMNDRCVTCVQ